VIVRYFPRWVVTASHGGFATCVLRWIEALADLWTRACKWKVQAVESAFFSYSLPPMAAHLSISMVLELHELMRPRAPRLTHATRSNTTRYPLPTKRSPSAIFHHDAVDIASTRPVGHVVPHSCCRVPLPPHCSPLSMSLAPHCSPLLSHARVASVEIDVLVRLERQTYFLVLC
jgi:hypothetical protein